MERNTPPPKRWNPTEVSEHLLPFLRLSDAERRESTPEEQLAALRRDAGEALLACPAAYRQLSRVYHRADDQTFATWFGGIDCDDALLTRAFTWIDQGLRTTVPSTELRSSSGTFHGQTDASACRVDHLHPQLGEDAAFRGTFRISHSYTDAESGKVRWRVIDLLAPFIELLHCEDDGSRLRCEEICHRAVQTHLSDYIHAIGYYRENNSDAEFAATLLPETRRCMAYLEQVIARCDAESQLRRRKAALEYERGGLGWFHKQRKQQIDGELREIAIAELEFKIQDEQTKLQIHLAPLQEQIEAWEAELAHAPVTAFARKRELRKKIREAEAQLDQAEHDSEIPLLRANLAALQKQQRKYMRSNSSAALSDDSEKTQ